MPRREEDARSGRAAAKTVVMRLYIANNAPNSVPCQSGGDLQGIPAGQVHAGNHRCARASVACPGRRHPRHAQPCQGIPVAGREGRRRPGREKQRAARAGRKRISRLGSSPERKLPRPAGLGFEGRILRLVKGAPELRAIESGQVDAVIDPATGKAFLLPDAQQALREAQARNRSLLSLSADWLGSWMRATGSFRIRAR